MKTTYTYRTVIHEKLIAGLGLGNLPDFSNKLGLFSHQLPEEDFKKIFEDRSESLPYDKFGTLLGYGYIAGADDSIGSNQFMYVKLGVLLELLNTIIPKDDSGQRLFTFNTQQGLHKYRTITDHISTDPGICILPRLTSLKEVNEAITDSPYIVDIFISVTHILTTLDSTVRSGNELDILTYIENILSEVELALGDINSFELQFFEESQEFSIVDRASIVQRSYYPQIRLTGTNSIVREVNLVSKLSPSITAAIAISSQGSPYSTGVEATGFEFLNRGIEDSVMREKVVGNLEKFKDEDKVKSIGIARAELSTEIGDFIKKMYFRTLNGELNKIQYNKEDTQYLRQIFSNYYKFLISIERNPSFSFIVPFELQLTLDGISGLQVMEAFTIAEEILPYPYRSKPDGSRVVFMVTGLEHAVSPQGWVTKVKAQIFLSSTAVPVVSDDLFVKDEQPVVVETVEKNSLFKDFVTNTPWSAAFIVYCVTKRGVNFPKSAAHTRYSQNIRTGGYPFTALDPATTKLKRGDIIVKNRASNTLTFNSAPWSGYSHGDIVNFVDGTKASIIGGNVGDTVTAGNVSLLNRKLVNANKGIPGSYFVVLRPNNSTDASKIANEAVKQYKLINSRKETDDSIAVNLDEYYRSANLNPPPIT